MKKILIFTLFIGLYTGCKQVKHKEEAVVAKAKQAARSARLAIVNKKDLLLDKVIPAYDEGQPDSKANKKRFAEHLAVDVTADVKNIYAFGDFFGIDYKVLISFTCNQLTADKIIVAHKMKLSGELDNGLGFLDEFTWWNKEKMATIRPYKFGKEDEYWEYFWYDAKTGKAWYEEYSL